jgi:hypothetical protein
MRALPLRGMPIAMRSEPVVTHPPIGMHQAARLDDLVDEPLQAARRSVHHAPQSNATDLAALVLDGDDNEELLDGPTSGRAFLERADERLVDFDLARQPFPTRADHCAPEFVQPRPGRLIAAQPQELLQGERACSGLRRRHGPHRPKPDRQRRAGVLEDRAGRHGGLPTAGRALQPQASHRPRRRVPTSRTAEAFGPAQPLEIRAARVVGPELRLEFGLISRVFRHQPEHYLLGSPESSG